MFDKALRDMNDPMWDDIRPLFKNKYQKFLQFVENLSVDDSQKLFEVLWKNSLQKIIDKREFMMNNKNVDDWDRLLSSVHITKSEILSSYKEEFYI